MNFALIQVAFDSDLDPRERLVLLALANHCRKGEITCYPSVARLMEKAGYGERSVQGALIALEERGYITIGKNKAENGKNLYTLHETPAESAPPQDLRPRKDCEKPPQNLRKTPAESAPEMKEKYKEITRAREEAPRKPGAGASKDAPPAPRNLPSLEARKKLSDELFGKGSKPDADPETHMTNELECHE